jgi:signal transduction histidine kinase
MSRLVDSLPCGVATFLLNGTLLDTNEALRDLVQFDAEAPLSNFSQILSLPTRIFCQTHVYPLLQAQGTLEEIYLDLRTPDGGNVPVMMNARLIEDGGRTAIRAVFLAMRRRSLYEDEILRARREAQAAQERLQARTAELEALKQELEARVELRTEELSQANEELRGFVYSIVHDIGAPLRAIDSTSAILLTEDSEGLSEDQRFLLERQIVNVRKLHALIEGLLSYARLSQKAIVKNRISLSKMAVEIVKSLRKAEPHSDAWFDIGETSEVLADADAVRVVLTNLLDNAAKYSPNGGRIAFGVKDGAFFVQDEGIGFDMRYAEKIFRPFERLHRDVEFKGTGIGLANVKRIVERHGGHVWVESHPGAGSIFYFTLE